MEWIPWITTLLSIIGAILAWAAKLVWSKEFADAKNEVIRAREAEIQTKEAYIETLKQEIEIYRDLTPMKMQEYLHATKNGLEGYIEVLKNDLQVANNEITNKGRMISELSEDKTRSEDKIMRLNAEKLDLESKVVSLTDTFSMASEAQDKIATISGSYDQFTARFSKYILREVPSEDVIRAMASIDFSTPKIINIFKEQNHEISEKVIIADRDLDLDD